MPRSGSVTRSRRKQGNFSKITARKRHFSCSDCIREPAQPWLLYLSICTPWGRRLPPRRIAAHSSRPDGKPDLQLVEQRKPFHLRVDDFLAHRRGSCRCPVRDIDHDPRETKRATPCGLKQAGDDGGHLSSGCCSFKKLKLSERQPRRWLISQDTAMHLMRACCRRTYGGILTKPSSAIRRGAGSRKNRRKEHPLRFEERRTLPIYDY